MLCNFVSLYGLHLLSPCRTAKLDNHPLSAIRDSLINKFAGRSSIRRYSVECYCSSTDCGNSCIFFFSKYSVLMWLCGCCLVRWLWGCEQQEDLMVLSGHLGCWDVRWNSQCPHRSSAAGLRTWQCHGGQWSCNRWQRAVSFGSILDFMIADLYISWSQWLRGLRRTSAAAHLLR